MDGKIVALELCVSRFDALIHEAEERVPIAAQEEIATLRLRIADAERRIVALEAERCRLAAAGASPSWALAMDMICQHFESTIQSATESVPPTAASRISDLESRLRHANKETCALTAERDDARRIAETMIGLCEATVRWRKDRFSPRLEQAIDAYARQQVLSR